MKAFPWVLALVVSLFLTACNRGSDTSAPASSGGGGPSTSSGDYVGAMEKAHTLAIKTADLSNINNAIQQFNVAEGRYPKDLDELVSMKYFPRLPAPPPGQQYVYDPASGRVALGQK
jgi:hypothetical protein